MKKLLLTITTFKKYFSPRTSYLSPEQGFTLIELMLVMAIFVVLTGIATVNLFSFQHKSQISATLNTFIADMKNQQIKAMAGDTNGDTTVDNYGITFDSGNYQYVLFKGTYSVSNANNFVVSVPNTIQLTTTSANSQIIFAKGSGEVNGLSSGVTTITLRDTVSNEQKVIQLNRYGVITEIN